MPNFYVFFTSREFVTLFSWTGHFLIKGKVGTDDFLIFFATQSFVDSLLLDKPFSNQGETGMEDFHFHFFTTQSFADPFSWTLKRSFSNQEWSRDGEFSDFCTSPS